MRTHDYKYEMTYSGRSYKLHLTCDFKLISIMHMYKKNNETFQNMLYLQTPATNNFVFRWQLSPTDR